MPFGLVFGALFFGGLCTWLGVRFLLESTAGGRLAGGSLLLLGAALALGLVQRQRWARWAGVAGGLVLAGLALRLVARGAGVPEHLLLFAALAAVGLLLVPTTGDPLRGASGEPRRRGWLAAGAVAGLAGMALAAWWSDLQVPAPRRAGLQGLPAAALQRGVAWTDFGTGLARARSEGKALMVTFVAPWCGFCKKMDRQTWRAPIVVERLEGLVAVRVDGEETRERNGYVGAELAARYGVTGYPVHVVLDPSSGRELARAQGSLSPDEFLAWLDDALADSSLSRASTSSSSSTPSTSR